MSEETSRLGCGAWRPLPARPPFASSGLGLTQTCGLPVAVLAWVGPRDAVKQSPSVQATRLCPPFGLRRGIINTTLRQGLHL